MTTMRVVMNTVDEFLAEIEAESQHVLGGIVRLRIDREPEQPEAVTFRVGACLSAVVVNDSGPYLVEFGQVLGSDDHRTPTGGSDAAAEIEARTRSLCERLGLQVRSGKIEAV